MFMSPLSLVLVVHLLQVGHPLFSTDFVRSSLPLAPSLARPPAAGLIQTFGQTVTRSTLQNPPSALLPQSFHLNLDLNNLGKDGEPAVKISLDLFTAEARREANFLPGRPRPWARPP